MNRGSLTDSATLEVWLTRTDADADWLMVNARARYAAHSTRMMLDSPAQLHEALHPELAHLLQTKLAHVDNSAVFSQSDFALQLPSVFLHGLRVLTHVAEDGSASASVRIVHTMGNLSAVFSETYGGEIAPERAVSDVTLPVLQELLIPALEVMDHILEKGLNDEQAALLAARVKTMRARRDELSDYISLLTRYMECCARFEELSQPVSEADAATGITSEARGDSGEVLSAPAPAALALTGPRGPDGERDAMILTAATGRIGQDLSWSPGRGMIRGDRPGILHGHHHAARRREVN